MRERKLVIDIWNSMMTRCYNKKSMSYSNYGGRGVTVCQEWHNFENYLTWYNKYHVEGWEVDKDIKGSLEYSPQFCLFVPPEINMLLSNLRRKDNVAKGVYFEKESGKFKAQLSIVENGKKKRLNLGRFNNVQDAYDRYLECKRNWMLVQAGRYVISGNMAGEVFVHTLMIANNLREYLKTGEINDK